MPFPELKILSQEEAKGVVYMQPKKWNVISIHSERESPKFPKARRVHQQLFHDIEDNFGDEGYVICTEGHIKEILNFARSKYGEPLLVHCRAGISRSSAITLVILLDYFHKMFEPQAAMNRAIDKLLQIKNHWLIYPNPLIVKLGIKVISKNDKKVIHKYVEAYNNHAIVRKVFKPVEKDKQNESFKI